MFQRLASKHYKLRDSKLAEWRSASGHRQTENTTGKPRKARPMAAQLKKTRSFRCYNRTFKI